MSLLALLFLLFVCAYLVVLAVMIAEGMKPKNRHLFLSLRFLVAIPLTVAVVTVEVLAWIVRLIFEGAEALAGDVNARLGGWIGAGAAR